MISNSSKYTSFTLIELLIVIVIIGILAVALIPRLTGIQGQARDKQRLVDLKQLQTALEMYAAENKGNYPITNNQWRGVCPNFSSGGTYTTSGPNGYIPGLSPTYVNTLPIDPKPKGVSNCYIYKSNTDGSEYYIMAYGTAERSVPDEFIRPRFPTENSIAIYSPGAYMW